MLRRCIFAVITALFLTAEIAGAVYMLSSSAQIADEAEVVKRDITISEFDDGVNNITSDVLSGIFEIPKAYVLPLVDEAMPVPNPAGYSVVTDSDIQTWNNTDILRYEDETVCVTVWKEYYTIGNSYGVANFAEIKVAHPTQIRRHMAGWDYGNKRKTTTAMSKEVNAIVAISGDFYSYRRNGIIINNKTVYRNAPSDTMSDTLFVNSDGDFIIKSCKKGFDTDAFLKENDIMFSMSFGPAIIVDGRLQTYQEAVNYNGEGHPGTYNPRAAIGQIGTLHYLFCTVDGRTRISKGISTSSMAKLMSEKGCVNAYNLDGGQSATLVFKNKVFNTVSNGGERYIADMVYIATANPN